MKTYIDYDKTVITYNGTSIPKDERNRDYITFLEEQKSGKAVLIPYVLPEPTWDSIRNKRDILLKETDWTDLPNTPLLNKQAWINYRQQLRDLPQAFPAPKDVIWPNKPE